jgi:signal peptidase I
MVPTLKVHDRVIVSRISYRLHDPNRGDIVVFDNPNFDEPKRSLPKRLLRDMLEVVGINQPKDKNLIKRVIGLPGETVQGRDGHVFIDGKQLPESYLPDGITTGDFAPVTVPAGHFWVMGDNRGNSADSRFMAQSECATTTLTCPKGTIARSSIVGRAFVRIWPPWRIALL